MPIRPEMKPLYPPPKEWKAIRERILARAGNACECFGECGIEHFGRRCGVPNRTRIVRQTIGKTTTWIVPEQGARHRETSVDVVLTTAHLDHDPTNNDEANLRSFCQLCHLRYDRHEHAKNSANTRQRKADEASGQVALFDAARARLKR